MDSLGNNNTYRRTSRILTVPSKRQSLNNVNINENNINNGGDNQEERNNNDNNPHI